MTVGDGGSVDPPGTTTHTEGIPVTLTASWDDATHTFGGWGGDCSGAEPTCELTMDADKTVTATFAERCQSATDPTCIRVVYQGAPDDYTQVADPTPSSSNPRRTADISSSGASRSRS